VPTIIERLHQLGVGRRTLGVELEGWAETYGEDLVRLVECEATRGSITQRGRGSWQVAFRTGGGDRVRETVRGTRTEAERRLTEPLLEYDMTGLVPDREATVSMFAEQWLEHVAHRIKPITLKRYRELLTVHVVPVIGSIHMTELRPAGVQAVVTKVLDRRSPRTAVNTYRVLSEMLGEGVRWGVMATNPALAIRPPRAPRADLHIPDATTCTAILERARGRSVEGALTLALGTGMRLGEILAVRWRDVDLERKALHVTATLSYLGGEFTFPQPKTSRARRSVDLPVFVVGFLRRHRKDQNTRKMARRRVWEDYDIVLDDGFGLPLVPWSVSADFRRVVSELGLPRTRFHDLRHAHATQLLGAWTTGHPVSRL
jgi:integrase